MNTNRQVVSLSILLTALFLASQSEAKLSQSFQQTGNYGLEVHAIGGAAASTFDSSANGNFNISTQAALSTPVQAYLYAMDSNHPGTMSASFNSMPLLGGTFIGAYDSDSAFSTLYNFRWDVTTLIVPAVTSYSWAFSEFSAVNQGNGIGLVALALVYSDPSLPNRTATIFDGMTYVGNTHPETETVNFTGIPAGSNTIFNVTYFDDNFAPPNTTGETISFDGTIIGGPLDGNLSLNGSLSHSTGNSNAVSNAMSISTNADEFGWVLSATLTTAVPIPGAVWLLLSGISVLGVLRRRWFPLPIVASSLCD